MTTMETFGIECRAASHPSKIAYIALLSRRPGERDLQLWPIKPFSTDLIRQQIDENAEPYTWMTAAPDGSYSPDARAATAADRTRLTLKCPLCGLHVVKRWPDPQITALVNGLLDAGESRVSLTALAARVSR